jgi:hypothetical protein
MDNKKKEYWFPAKRYGWGWGMPSTWQGWVTLTIYMILIAACAFLLPPAEKMALFWCLTGLFTLLLIVVCWVKGEPPRWRWGKDKNTKAGS